MLAFGKVIIVLYKQSERCYFFGGFFLLKFKPFVVMYLVEILKGGI